MVTKNIKYTGSRINYGISQWYMVSNRRKRRARGDSTKTHKEKPHQISSFSRSNKCLNRRPSKIPMVGDYSRLKFFLSFWGSIYNIIKDLIYTQTLEQLKKKKFDAVHGRKRNFNNSRVHIRFAGMTFWILTRSRQRVPPVARTRLSHRAACTTGGARLIVPSGGVYHRWLALGSHRAACRPMKRDVDLYAAAGWNKCKSAPAWTC